VTVADELEAFVAAHGDHGPLQLRAGDGGGVHRVGHLLRVRGELGAVGDPGGSGGGRVPGWQSAIPSPI
jgi:hypothetical protein